jgi:hypothetical protein
LINEAGTVREGFDFSNFLAPLDTNGIAMRLSVTPKGEYTSYFAGTQGLGTRMVEQSIRFIEEETRSEEVRNHLMGLGETVGRPSLLAVTYTAGLDQPYYARAPVEGAGEEVYGTGYELMFTTPSGFSGPRRGLASIEEYDLLSNRKRPDAVWDCGQGNYTFVIVRPTDATTATSSVPATSRTCLTVADGATETTSTALEKKRLELARRVLRAEDWFIDAKHRCIVSKSSDVNSCYGNVHGVPTVNYTTACTGGNCPHFVTVCERK